MSIIETLLKTLPAEPVPVRRVVIGVHWTIVSSRFGGLSSTMVGEGPHGHSRIKDVGKLHEKSAQELAQLLGSDNLLEASIGMAAFNSLNPVSLEKVVEVNASEIIARESKDKNLVIIGHFPFTDRMKTIAKTCRVIEKRPHGDDFPEDTAHDFVPQADMVAITGTALINHTIDGLLALCRPETKVMILGGSTPVTPRLFDFGVDYLSGSMVTDEEAAGTTIQQGASFPQILGVKHVTLTKGA